MDSSNRSSPALVNQTNHVNNSSSTLTMNDTAIRIEMTEFILKVNFWLLIVEIIMVAFGLFGNGLALIVVNRRSLRGTSSSIFITYLAIFDIAVLVVQIIGLATSQWILPYILHCSFAYLTDLVTFCSVWIMVIMTLDRCIAVRSPFLAKRFCTIGHARYSIYILIVFAVLFFSTTFPIIHEVDYDQQKCVVRSQYQTIIRIVKPSIFYFVPDLLLLANLFVIYELFAASRQRKKTLMNPENAISQLNAVTFNRKQQQLTIMLVTVSLSFYLFTTPAIVDYINQLYQSTTNDIKRLKRRFFFMNFTVLWLQMSSATNFLFYCIAGSKFRTVSVETLSDICDFVRDKFTDEEEDGTEPRRRRRRRRKRPSGTDIRLTSMSGPMTQHSLLNIRPKIPSKSLSRPLNDTLKRQSNDTCNSSLMNSRRTSKLALNLDEI